MLECIILVGDVTDLMFTMAQATVKRLTVCRPNLTANSTLNNEHMVISS